MSGDSAAGCFVCRKHRDRGPLVPGGFVAEDDLVLVSHVVPPDVLGREGTTAYLGHLLVEPRRHAPGLADLTDAEARAVGWWCTQASRALRGVSGAEHVYAAVLGDGVPHLHVHLLPRFPGTPREYWGTDVDEWPQARRGSAAQIGLLVQELRGYLLNEELPALRIPRRNPGRKDAAVQIPSGRYSLVENGAVPALSGCTATGG